ncbi:hexokinase A [Thoreauomyces humboldtii]|nr:hexokinase A [Thoreauomyces humboldtii]
MSSLWPNDNRASLIFALGVTAGIALATLAQYFNATDGGNETRSPEHVNAQISALISRKEVETVTQRLEREFTISTTTMHTLQKAFLRDMDRGLKREGTTLKMIPSFVVRRPTGNETGTLLALDLGGSNFRVCEVTLKGKGQVRSRQKKFVVSEELKTGAAIPLFDFFADCVSSTMDEFGLDKKISLKMGFTFSFPVDQHAINKGSLFHWTKGFTASGVVGEDAVKLLQDAFIRKDIKINITALVNDTVGTLISHAYLDNATLMGVILGTGSNAAYVEKIENIPKWKGPIPESGEMVINMEWGAWGQDGFILPVTEYDKRLDRASPNPKKQQYEKMLSGLYLGELTRQIIIDLISTGHLFSGRRCPALETEHSFETELLSRIERDHSLELTDTRSIFEDLFSVTKTSLADRRLVKRICELVGTRAARLAAVGVASVVTKMNKLGGCTVAIDGSVFEHYPHFPARMRDGLRELLGVSSDTIILAQEIDEVEVKVASDGSAEVTETTTVLEIPTSNPFPASILQEDDGDSEYEDEHDDEQERDAYQSDASDLLSEYEDDDGDDSDLLEESLLERIQALRDVIPPATRASVARGVTSVTSGTWTAVQWVGSAAWVFATAAMLVALPVALELEREQFVFQQEAQMRAQQQQAQQMVQPGLGGIPGGIPGGQPQLPGMPTPQI